MNLPKYIAFRNHGETCAPLPIDIQRATLYGFALRVNKGTTQRYVDLTLNSAATGRFEYSVLGNHVLLVFVHAYRGTCSSVGWEEDRETCFFIPLVQKVPAVPRLFLWPSYIMISSALGLTIGREILGYNKSQGFTKMSSKGSQQLSFSTSTVIFDPLAGGTEGKLRTLVSVQQKEGSPRGRFDNQWPSTTHAFREISDALRTFEDIVFEASLTGGLSIPTINLKQFRDAEQNDLACYQALVVHDNRITNWYGGGLLPGKYSVELTPCASHQIAEDLGFDDAVGTNVYQPDLALWVEVDFSIMPGRNIWQAL